MQRSMKNEFSSGSSPAKMGILTAIFMDQIKSVLTEKHDFEKRQVSNLIFFWNNLGYQVSDARNRSNIFVKGMVWQKFKAIG